MNSMLLVIPMAGRGSRYANVGYQTPKPLIEVNGKPMLYHAFQSVKNVPYRKVVFIALREHEEQYGVRKMIDFGVWKNPIDFGVRKNPIVMVVKKNYIDFGIKS